jgi:hypothetical protein
MKIDINDHQIYLQEALNITSKSSPYTYVIRYEEYFKDSNEHFEIRQRLWDEIILPEIKELMNSFKSESKKNVKNNLIDNSLDKKMKFDKAVNLWQENYGSFRLLDNKIYEITLFNDVEGADIKIKRFTINNFLKEVSRNKFVNKRNFNKLNKKYKRALNIISILVLLLFICIFLIVALS